MTSINENKAGDFNKVITGMSDLCHIAIYINVKKDMLISRLTFYIFFICINFRCIKN